MNIERGELVHIRQYGERQYERAERAEAQVRALEEEIAQLREEKAELEALVGRLKWQLDAEALS